MQTTAPMERASTFSAGDVMPMVRKRKQVSIKVATVMLEIGFEEEPISPVRRDDTVTKRKPNKITKMAPSMAVPQLISCPRKKVRIAISARQPKKTTLSERS